MRTYLSIDLDYWLADCWSDPAPLRGLFWMLRNVDLSNCVVVDEHHELLDHLHTVDADTILHVDYHSDVAFPLPQDKKALELNCGTFFWFMHGRENKSYTWFYPEADCPRNSGLCMDPSFKPLSRKNWIFKEQRRKMGLPSRAQLSTVTAVGIAASRDFCQGQERLQRLIQILERRYLPPTTQWEEGLLAA